MCLSVHRPICTRLQVMSPKILQKRTILCRSNRYRTHIDLWFRREHRDFPLTRIGTMRKYGPCWLHHCVCSREKPVLTNHESITPQEKTRCRVPLVRESSRKPAARESTGKPSSCFHTMKKLSQEALSDRGDYSSKHQQVPGNNEPLCRFSHPENSMKSFLEERGKI